MLTESSLEIGILTLNTHRQLIKYKGMGYFVCMPYVSKCKHCIKFDLSLHFLNKQANESLLLVGSIFYLFFVGQYIHIV